MAWLNLMSVSWIDNAGLPAVNPVSMLSAGMPSLGDGWTDAVVIGLVGTANPTPPESIPVAKEFFATQQYRAALCCGLDRDGSIVEKSIDPGFTPPFSRGKFGSIMGTLLSLGIKDDPKFYPGEVSALSAIGYSRHRASMIELPRDAKVLASAFIKFRAGAHTDNIGISDAGSPYHVPWVWCEYVVARIDNKVMVYGKGSSFPSHAWYINGKCVGKVVQQQVQANKIDKVLSSGLPASQLLPAGAMDNA